MTDDRVAAIRFRVEAEQAILSGLAEKLKARHVPWLKSHLQFASNTIGDVESVFLRRLNERRTPDLLSDWLDQAALCLQLGVEHRKFVEHLVAVYGTEIEEVG